MARRNGLVRVGQTITFEVDGVAREEVIARVIFNGASKYVPDGPSVWREILIFEATSSMIVVRDRACTCVEAGKTQTLRVEWRNFATVDEAIESFEQAATIEKRAAKALTDAMGVAPAPTLEH